MKILGKTFLRLNNKIIIIGFKYLGVIDLRTLRVKWATPANIAKERIGDD